MNANCFMHKYKYNKLPDSFNGMFEPLALSNRTNSYKLQRTKYKGLDSFPAVCLPKLWNSLTLDQKSIRSLKLFRNNLKKAVLFRNTSHLERAHAFLVTTKSCCL